MHAAVVFPGQGSQFVGMGDGWDDHAVAREVFQSASAASGRDIVAEMRDQEALEGTDVAQVAILACDVAAFRVLEADGVEPVGVAGHSLGEFAALVAAGVLDLESAVRIVAVRGRAMQAAAERFPGAMTALIGVGTEDAGALCEQARGNDVLLVANENSPHQVVISGSVAAIERAEALGAERRIRSIRLSVAGAFHSPLMEPAVEPLSMAIEEATFATPRFPVAANVTGSLVEDPEDLRDLLERHVVSPVRWERCVAALAAAGADTFVEAGPGNVLTKLAKRLVPDAAAIAVGSADDARAVAARLASADGG
jgi:[acyl-carrier-protein] S-malonyltransferase